MIRGRAARCLIVDDDGDWRALLGLRLEGAGYAVTGCDRGEAALALLRDGLRPDVVVLDLHLPDLSGDRLLEALARLPVMGEVPVVLLSGGACPRWGTGALRVEDTFTKPVDFGRLLASLRRIVARPEA